VVREISPDYGLDLHIEVFEPVEEGSESADAYGEHFFAQVKTTISPQRSQVTVRSRQNVAIGPLQYNAETPAKTIEVIRFSIETPELRTIEAMGAAIPVLLLIVDDQTGEVYFICLNDYISKVLNPENPDWRNQASSTIRVPTFNKLDHENPDFSYIRMLAMRAKMMAAFVSFNYQNHQFVMTRDHLDDEALPPLEHFASSEVGEMLKSFLRANLALDIWDHPGLGHWHPLIDVQQDMTGCLDALQNPPDISTSRFLLYAGVTFSRADNLGRMHEEIVREWRMPTALAALIQGAEEADYSYARSVQAIEESG